MGHYLTIMQSMAKASVVFTLLILFLGAYVLLNFTHLPFSIPALQEASGGKTILNVLPHYDATVAYEHIASYAQEAVDIYYRILLIDALALIPVYVMFLTTGLLHAGNLVLRNRGQTFLHVLAISPAVAAALNLLEDGIVVYLIESYPLRHETLATVCGFITSTKSLLLTASLLAIAALYLVAGLGRAFGRTESKSRLNI